MKIYASYSSNCWAKTMLKKTTLSNSQSAFQKTLQKSNAYHGSIRKTLLTHHWNCSAYYTCNANASSKLKKNTANTFHLKNSKNKMSLEVLRWKMLIIFHPLFASNF